MSYEANMKTSFIYLMCLFFGNNIEFFLTYYVAMSFKFSFSYFQFFIKEKQNVTTIRLFSVFKKQVCFCSLIHKM